MSDSGPMPLKAESLRTQRRVRRIGEPLLFLLSVVAVLGTLALLMGIGVAPSERRVKLALTLDTALALLLAVLVGFRLYRLYRARWSGRAGARLHLKVVSLLALASALPTAVVALAAMLTLDRGLTPWFSGNLKVLVENAGSIAGQFQQQLCQNVVREMRLMAVDIERAYTGGVYSADRKLFREFMTSRAVYLGLPFAAIMRNDLSTIEKADVGVSSGQFTPSAEDFQLAGTDEPPCILSREVLGSVTKLKAIEGGYLVVGRPIDRRAIEFPLVAQAGVEQYQELEARREATRFGIAVVFVLLTLLVTLAAVLLGLGLSDTIVQPIGRLIQATDEVSSGNLYVQVPVRGDSDDVSHLGSTFNKMTNVLRTQNNSLVAANELIDRRRRFMEAVLSGVPAGVLGVDPDGFIRISNPTADDLLGTPVGGLVNRPLAEVLPQLAARFHETQAGASRLMQETIEISRGGRNRTLSVRMTHEAGGGKGVVVTLDDITDLVTAQRTSAWADVARRIAHEIKNPLTPIQLSAERIRRKFGKLIHEDRAVFDQCTETIVRQVEDIKRMVDEFSSFARMPKPTLAEEDLVATVKEVTFLMRLAHPDIDINDQVPDQPIALRFDRRLIAQAVQNIIKNATEAIAAVPSEQRGQGRIVLTIHSLPGGDVAVDVIDNGKGFPVENRERLLEPYMTERVGGTGLGLAIVAKILEDHGGRIELLDAPDGRGACVRLRLPAGSGDSAQERTPVA
ncbi:MAG TPA: PAS domain-containing sensor histidine kinase [Beijerinckiaceae bacterium]|nr:PAS domain-containing sensor histidine kinase [Beijerinckiaceae bacterium]